MKKAITLLLLPFILVSCELLDNDPDNDGEAIDTVIDIINDDDEDNGPYYDENPNLKAVTVQTNCNGGSVEDYCITEGTFSAIIDQVNHSNDPCIEISFSDIDGVSRHGFFVSAGYNVYGCLRE